MSQQAQQFTPEQAAAAAAFQEPRVAPEVYSRIAEERETRSERPIDLVRRYANEILLRKGAFSSVQLTEMYPDFAARYQRLFKMLLEPRFEPRFLDALLREWESNMDGAIVDRSGAEKNTEYHRQSQSFGAFMGKTFVEPVVSRIPPATKPIEKHE
jgi:hypothetical protein